MSNGTKNIIPRYDRRRLTRAALGCFGFGGHAIAS